MHIQWDVFTAQESQQSRRATQRACMLSSPSALQSPHNNKKPHSSWSHGALMEWHLQHRTPHNNQTGRELIHHTAEGKPAKKKNNNSLWFGNIKSPTILCVGRHHPPLPQPPKTSIGNSINSVWSVLKWQWGEHNVKTTQTWNILGLLITSSGDLSTLTAYGRCFLSTGFLPAALGAAVKAWQAPQGNAGHEQEQNIRAFWPSVKQEDPRDSS